MYYCTSQVYIYLFVSSSLHSVSNQLINTSKYGQNKRDFIPGKPVFSQIWRFCSFFYLVHFGIKSKIGKQFQKEATKCVQNNKKIYKHTYMYNTMIIKLKRKNVCLCSFFEIKMP